MMKYFNEPKDKIDSHVDRIFWQNVGCMAGIVVICVGIIGVAAWLVIHYKIWEQL